MSPDVILNEEEQWIEDHLEEFEPAPKWVGDNLREAAQNTMAAIKKKRTITINLDDKAIVYFKNLSEETGIPYQNLINLYLVQCAKDKKRLSFI